MTVSQPLFTGFNLLNAYQKAELQEDEKELELENSRLALVGQVQARFLEYLKAQEISAAPGARWNDPAPSSLWPAPRMK